MSAALQLSYLASNDDLHRVIYPVSLSRFDVVPGDLSDRERWLLSVLLVLVSLGYSEIRCYLSALTDCANRAHKSNKSTRTTRRVLSDFEGRGWLRRRTFRRGDMLHIDLLPILADMLAKKKPVAVSQVSDISAHRTGCPPPETDHSPNSEDPVFSSNAPRAGDDIDQETVDYYERQSRDRNKRERKNSERWDPVARSVWYVGGAARNWLRRMASEEIRTGGGLSGVDWSRWRAAWPSMLREEREHIARTVICPALIAAMRGDLPLLEAENEKATEGNFPRGRELKPKNRTNDKPSDPDLAALWEARERAKKRAADLNRWDREQSDRTVEAPLEDSEEIRTRILHSLGKPARTGGQCGA